MSEEIKECVLCGLSNSHFYWRSLDDQYFVECKRCKEYIISREYVVFSDVRGELKKYGYLLSGLSREYFENNLGRPEFHFDKINEILKNHILPDPKDPIDRAKKLLARIRERTEYFGQFIELDTTKDYSLAYAKNEDEFRAILALLNKKKYTNATTNYREYPGGTAKIQLLEDGWEFTNSNISANTESNQGFVAAWFDSSTNEYIDTIVETIKKTGFKPVCIRDEKFPERIMDKSLSEIRKSRFLVIDTTGSRPSVFFEAGFAEALNLQIFYVHKGEVPKEFYVKHYQFYIYNNREQLGEILSSAIESRIKNPKSSRV